MTLPAVWKTYKLFIAGQFPRSESGRVLVGPPRPDGGVTRIAHASRKDMRNAVQAARKAQPGWARATATLRGQVAWRLAEMLESRAALFLEALRATGLSDDEARHELQAAIDRTVWWAGWSDKYEPILGTVNPVAGPFVNWSRPEPMGVIAILAPPSPGLLGLVSTLLPALISGNATVVVAPVACSVLAMELAEAIATSDVPGGVVNLLTGPVDELLSHIAHHEDIDGVIAAGLTAHQRRTLEEGGAHNMKRCHFVGDGDSEAWYGEALASPWLLQHYTELKTTWHTHGF